MNGSSSTGGFEPRIKTCLEALFGHLPPGAIEVRVIIDKRGGRLIDHRWYESAGHLADDLDDLNRVAMACNAGVFVGVLPRVDRSSGTTDNVAPGLVAWADLDFKDFEGGEREARERLASFPRQPSIVVRSGHGLHAYWIVREPTAPAELSGLSKSLARVLGADHAFDAARILRLPGTFNRKDPSKPLPVEIELIEPERAYNISEIAEAVAMHGGSEEPSGNGPDLSGVEIGDELPDKVKGVLFKRPRITNLFNGEGKPGYGPDGQRLDTSSSGYDFSVLLALVKQGITDPSDLATTLNCRPDGGAKAKGQRYIEHTVSKVLGTLAAADVAVAQASLNFEVEKVRVFDSNPARYELTINGARIVLGSADLRAKARFAIRFMDALRFVPELPEKEDWTALVNSWLKDPEVVPMGPEANAENVLREVVTRVISDLPTGAVVEDLDRHMAVPVDGGGDVGFKAEAVLTRLHEEGSETERSDLCRVLSELGYTSGSDRIGGKPARVWRQRA